MLLFGHLGITLGVGIAGYELYQRVKGVPEKDISRNDNGLPPWNNKTSAGKNKRLWIITAILFGSMLPDIIDKPLGHYLMGDFFGYNGRIIAHTLLFALVILILGLFIYIWRKSILGLLVWYGVLMHLILDSMWKNPRTLLWPALGWHFARSEEYDFLHYIFNFLLNDPSAFIPEIIGGVMLAAAVFIWWRKDKRSNI
jgi:inner membrane protein